MLILILIYVHYSQNAIFSFEKGWNRQNHSSSFPFHPVKKFLPVKFPITPQLENRNGGNFPPNPYRYLENPDI